MGKKNPVKAFKNVFSGVNYTKNSFGNFSNVSNKPMDNDKFNEKLIPKLQTI